MKTHLLFNFYISHKGKFELLVHRISIMVKRISSVSDRYSSYLSSVTYHLCDLGQSIDYSGP